MRLNNRTAQMRKGKRRMSGSSEKYRDLLMSYLSKAEARLATGEDDDVIYACLELRKCLEAYAYMHLVNYLSQVTFDLVQRRWQADKVIKELIAIDPMMSTSGFLTWRRDGSTKTQKVGEDRRLSTDHLKTYHKLGSFLHLPMVRSSRTKTDFDGARRLAKELCDAIAALYAPGWVNAHFNPPMWEFQCRSCAFPVARRQDRLTTGDTIECGNCGQRWEIEVENGELGLFFRTHAWDCKVCGADQEIDESKLVVGSPIACTACNASGIIKMSTWFVEYPEGTNKVAGAPPDEQG